jgi:peptidoglycan hydrolase-like protein with peptidoglycan-binding domain
VVEDTVGRSITVGGTAEWPATREVKTRRGGIVTWLPGDLDATDGDVVATIDLRPVVIGQGQVPSFRDLSPGGKGDDVEQLQALLVRLGFAEFEPDGDYGSATVAAVRAWQRSLGVPDTGMVALGDIVWVLRLPAVLRPAAGVGIDVAVESGAVLFEQLESEPAIVLSTSDDQLNLLPLDASVRVTYEGSTWDGVLGSGTRTEQGVTFPVEAPAGGPVCGEACGVLPRDRTVSVNVELMAVPSTTGPVVPLAAVTTDPGGATSVELADGTIQPVVILATADGMAVVDGVDIGEFVKLPEPD